MVHNDSLVFFGYLCKIAPENSEFNEGLTFLLFGPCVSLVIFGGVFLSNTLAQINPPEVIA